MQRLIVIAGVRCGAGFTCQGCMVEPYSPRGPRLRVLTRAIVRWIISTARADLQNPASEPG